MPPLVERPQAKREMDHRRGVEHGVDRQAAPEPGVPGHERLHRRVGNIAERVIEIMREDVGEQDEAGRQTHLPHADAAQPRHGARFAVALARTQVSDGCGLDRHARHSSANRRRKIATGRRHQPSRTAFSMRRSGTSQITATSV